LLTVRYTDSNFTINLIAEPMASSSYWQQQHVCISGLPSATVQHSNINDPDQPRCNSGQQHVSVERGSLSRHSPLER